MHIYLADMLTTACGVTNETTYIQESRGMLYCTLEGKIMAHTMYGKKPTYPVEVGGCLWTFVEGEDRYRKKIIFRKRVCKDCYGLVKLSSL